MSAMSINEVRAAIAFNLNREDQVEFDCELVKGCVVRKTARIIFADGRVEQLTLDQAQVPAAKLKALRQGIYG